MEIDHIFIFSGKVGKESDDLLNFSFVEGSNRSHPGQGIINRKFYFENFFLEIAWVRDEKEIKSDITSKAKLWERSKFRSGPHSRFGLCLENSESTDSLFLNSEKYQPISLAQGTAVDFIANDSCPRLPWTFRLPYRGSKPIHNEPTQHPNGIRSLSAVKFEVNTLQLDQHFVRHFMAYPNISFSQSERNYVVLEFDHHAQQQNKVFDKLDLTIHY